MCENCKKNEATVHMTQAIGGRIQSIHLCEECAQAMGLDLHGGKLDMGKFLEGIKNYELIKENDRIAVCISGGKDSMLMAACIKQLQTYSLVPFTAEYIVICLDEMEPIRISIDRIWSYTSLALEADYTDNALRERSEKVNDEATRMFSDMACVDSEILLAPDEELKAAVEKARGCFSDLPTLRGRPPRAVVEEVEIENEE